MRPGFSWSLVLTKYHLVSIIIKNAANEDIRIGKENRPMLEDAPVPFASSTPATAGAITAPNLPMPIAQPTPVLRTAAG